MNAVTEVMDELRKALAELEDCRARNADLRTMLEQVTRERDEWRDKFHALNQTAGELCDACGWAFKIPGEPCRCEVVRERDEARAEVEHAYREGGALFEAKIAEREAYRRGAEAMREACAKWMSEREGIAQWVYDDALSALPIPEET